MIQPKLQTSAGFEYLLDLRRTYGALYHRVATSSVITGAELVWNMDLTSPKSHNLIVQLELIKIFEGFRSRWIIKPLCKYFKALAIWYEINTIWTYFNIP